MTSTHETPSNDSSNDAGRPSGGRFRTLVLAAGLLVGEAVLLLGGYHYLAGPKAVVGKKLQDRVITQPQGRAVLTRKFEHRCDLFRSQDRRNALVGVEKRGNHMA